MCYNPPVLEIIGVDVWKLTIPRTQPFAIALGTIHGAENLLVRVRAAGGAYGWGEGSPLRYVTGETQATCFLLAGELGRLLLGRDALALGARTAEMDRTLAGNPTLKSAFDMALYDLAARHVGLPLVAFLGGERRSFWTDDTIGLDTPGAMAEAALGVLRRGVELGRKTFANTLKYVFVTTSANFGNMFSMAGASLL